MKFAAEMGTVAMTYTPSFIKIGSGIQKLIWGHTKKYRHTDRMEIA
jgi:hypothetical protein